jgi:hypothetical protein
MVAMLDSISMKAKMVVEGYIIGQHRSPYHGFSVEFAEHRSYESGDEVRHIDWKLYGKTNRLYVKRYEEETNLRAHLILDTSKSMAYTSGGVSKLENGGYRVVVGAKPSRAIVKMIDTSATLSNLKDKSNLDEEIERIVEEISFGTNMRASGEYREMIAKVLIRRNIQAVDSLK